MIFIFSKIDLNAKDEIQNFLKDNTYEACEYNFTTLFMWTDVYKTKFHREDDFILIVGETEDGEFTLNPLCKKENFKKAFEYGYNYLKNQGKKLYVRAATDELVDFLKVHRNGEFCIKEERDFFDYIYEAEKLRTLAGRKYHSKKNHFNKFLKEYEGRFEYKKIEKENINDCIEFLDIWMDIKDGENESLTQEKNAILKVLKNFDYLDCVLGGIYIDGKLQAFSFGDYINENLALIHVEKANPEINGLYSAINKLFLENEFPNVNFVNREEDMGIEGLRKAKESYKPVRFAKKYTVVERADFSEDEICQCQ